MCAVAIPLHSVSRSPKPHQRACGRQNDKARNQSASACSHTQTDACSRTDTHTHTHRVILTNRFITLTHLLIDTRCLLRTPSVILFPLLHTHTDTHTFDTKNRHRKSSVVTVYAKDAVRRRRRCLCLLTFSQTDIDCAENEIAFLLWILTFDAVQLSLSGTWEE